LHDARAEGATALGPDDADDFEVTGNVVEDFAGVFAQIAQGAATVGALCLLGLDAFLDAGERFRQGFASRAGMGIGARGRLVLLGCCFCVGAAGFQILQAQFELMDITLQTFGLLAEVHLLELLDEQFQIVDFVALRV
jgi:hypothetical protein